MSLGIVCDGTAEALALYQLVQRCPGAGRVLRPVYADMQPLAPPAQIVKAAVAKMQLLAERGAQRFLVLLDRENQEDCPGILASKLSNEFQKGGWRVDVVYKDRAFENWLIADPVGVDAAIPKVSFSQRIRRRIETSGADSLAAMTLLNDCVAGGYSKRRDAIRFCEVLDPRVAKRNSRSFRKFAKHFGF